MSTNESESVRGAIGRRSGGRAERERQPHPDPTQEPKMQRGSAQGLDEVRVRRGFESQEPPARTILAVGAALIVGLAVSMAAISTMLSWLRAPDLSHPARRPPHIAERPVEPKLEPELRKWRDRLETEARARLGGYAWVDRTAGIARIPVEEAMRIVAARGWHSQGRSDATVVRPELAPAPDRSAHPQVRTP